MAAELESLAQELRERGYTKAGELLEDSARSYLKRDLIPERLSRKRKEDSFAIDLVREIEGAEIIPKRELLISLGLMRLKQTHVWLARQAKLHAVTLDRIAHERSDSHPTAIRVISETLGFSLKGEKQLLDSVDKKAA